MKNSPHNSSKIDRDKLKKAIRGVAMAVSISSGPPASGQPQEITPKTWQAALHTFHAEASLEIPRGTPMNTYGPADPPSAFAPFCERIAEQCEKSPISEKNLMRRKVLTPEVWANLQFINLEVNTNIEDATDKDLYGQEDYWTIPTIKGDCEDKVLLKRQKLMEFGWTSGQLLITVVKNANGEGHAILTARTDHGELELDSLSSEIKPWNQLRDDKTYFFYSVQSYLNPKVWHSLQPRKE